METNMEQDGAKEAGKASYKGCLLFATVIIVTIAILVAVKYYLL